jgi:tRNA U34 5-carboxymethylaminomethyl modifying GTPase MnmE/TrmE
LLKYCYNFWENKVKKIFMKLSDYVVQFMEQKSDSVFLLSGGGIMHLVDSIGKSKLNMYCCHHEQAVATVAEGYARITNKPGFAVVTTGPGETMLETDRRYIRRRIQKIRDELKHVERHRSTARQGRHLTTFALVGYTNAGKSSV